METSILVSTKKLLGLGPDYTPFDLDIIICINSAFANVNQLGVGPVDGFSIDNADASWSDLNLPENQLSLLKTYVYLKTRSWFDPPTTRYVINAIDKQIEEHEWRLRALKENADPPPHPTPEVIYVEVFTGLEVNRL